MGDQEKDDPLVMGMIAGALVGAIAAAALLARRPPLGAGSDTRSLELPPPDSATIAEARVVAGSIVARLRDAFPNLERA
ncbi:MAG: hypothetical protein HXY39_20310 [Chloroflexi bacterium]|nr:hypothetical protein [Chloroflexota bacterium]